ncbi:bifunctional 4-hydroxy-2-oxoglutarate aldolase/2-dehydro-3-deoxy-phosphogluconate aldolase [Pelagibacterium xiamenense]|uniref:bifunctional 4-hydroxy-2-oxoglutarate aldolase/2-dehydro-3-deoxy-phosphogluconate aldolase n=1 Tax=Pelagibacterium xiamenense TaxID=2901140 RepID=UPI001E55C0A3|nr:bifunctional 4-hydroxy-2-oxoglutarate aldolase/2-dehydro-3-deoxy-phosphogluconate aldolase [Pelagibacterium xiamenense]MCD7060555.1 bifunctional 4-hydroxy-2-oxoglutarate aldolase/2-dehydro-3-deoxy-phosphogluconate aldolase [Pelagibacterium xiamenense]
MAQDAATLTSILSAAPVVPVIIHDDVSSARALAEALVAGGLPNLEITLRTPNALKVIAEMAKVDGAVVGSGTVRDLDTMKGSVDAGCRFMVSPGAPVKLLEDAEKVDIPLLPGIASPTEAMAASLLGYSYLKFFPAEAMGGTPVLKAFASPLADLKFCPTGGISLSNAKTYLSLPNVVCVGGSWVVPGDKVAAGDFDGIRALAAEAAALAG